MIREMNDQDGARVLEIYIQGLETRSATFETEVPSWNEWDIKHIKHSRLVYTDNERIIGWAALSQGSTRKVYSGVAEISIYIDTLFVNKGIGSLLMDELIKSSEKHGIWTLFSSVFPENLGTIKLHKKFGFKTIGIREKIAKLDNKWRDTILLERRSKVIGL